MCDAMQLVHHEGLASSIVYFDWADLARIER